MYPSNIDDRAAARLIKHVMTKHHVNELWLLNDLSEDDTLYPGLSNAIRFTKFEDGRKKHYRFTRFNIHDGVVSCRVQRVLNVGFGKESTKWIVLSDLYSCGVDLDTLRIIELVRWIEKYFNLCERANSAHKQTDETVGGVCPSQRDEKSREGRNDVKSILKNRLQDIEQQLKDKTSECIGLVDSISKLKASLAQSDKDVMTERESRRLLEKALKDATEKIEMLESKLQSHSSINDSLERENSELKQRCVQLESRIEELKSKIVSDTINAIYEKKKESITTEIESITEIKKKLMDEIEKLKAEINTLKENKSNLLFELDKSIEEKRRKIAEMNSNPRVRVKFELVYDHKDILIGYGEMTKEITEIKYFEMKRDKFLALREQSQLTILNFAVAYLGCRQDGTIESHTPSSNNKHKYIFKRVQISEVCTLFDLESEN